MGCRRLYLPYVTDDRAIIRLELKSAGGRFEESAVG
jgi:hypothetical protein